MQWILVNKWVYAFQLPLILSQRSFHKSLCYIVTDVCTIQSSGEFSGTWEALLALCLQLFWGLLSISVVVCRFFLQSMENRLKWASVIAYKLRISRSMWGLSSQLGDWTQVSLLLEDWFVHWTTMKWHDWALSSHRFYLCMLIRNGNTSPSPRTLLLPIWI